MAFSFLNDIWKGGKPAFSFWYIIVYCSYLVHFPDQDSLFSASRIGGSWMRQTHTRAAKSVKVHILICSHTPWALKLHAPYSTKVFRLLSYFSWLSHLAFILTFIPVCATGSFQNSFGEISTLKNIYTFVTDIFRGKNCFYQKSPQLADKQNQRSCCFQSPILYTILKTTHWIK